MDVLGPINQPTVPLKLRLSHARPVDGNPAQALFAGGFMEQPGFET